MKKNPLPFVVIVIGIVAIASYVIFRFYPLLTGPQITLISPTEKEFITTESSIEISLEHERLTTLKIQGERQDINDSGTSTYRYYLSEGNNTIKIQGCDQYETCRDIQIFVYKMSG